MSTNPSRSEMRRSIGSVVLVGTTGLFAMIVSADDPGSASAVQESYASYVSRGAITIRGTFRDFINADQPDGHPDFGRVAPDGAGRYQGIFDDELSAQGKPTQTSTGYRVDDDWTDASGRNIIRPRSYLNALQGDAPGSVHPSQGDAVTLGGPNQWFTTSGSTHGSPGSVTFSRDPSGGYTFRGMLDTGGSIVTGNAPSGNTEYTYEIGTTFIHDASQDWYIDVETDADAWVYIDNKLVIDGGGGLGASSSSVAAGAVVVEELIKLNGGSQIIAAPGGALVVSTNSTADSIVDLSGGSQIDGDVYIGPDGDPATAIKRVDSFITGVTDVLSATIPMPTITVPSLSSAGSIDLNSTSLILTSDARYDSVRLNSNAELIIDGDVTLVIDGELHLNNDTHLRLTPDSTLTAYVGGTITVNSDSTINAGSANPRLMSVSMTASATAEINSHSGVFMNLTAPFAQLNINSGCRFDGSFIGHSLNLNSGSVFTARSGGLVTQPIARWRFDEASGSVIDDQAGNHGTVMGDPVRTADGRIDGAMRFDGDDYVSVPANATLNLDGDFTVTGWFKLDAPFNADTPDSLVILEKTVDETQNFLIALKGNSDFNRDEVSDGSLVFKIENGGGSSNMEFRYKFTRRTSWQAGVWYHFAANMYSNNSSANQIFINGIDDTDPADAGTNNHIDMNWDAPFNIGGWHGDPFVIGDNKYFRGILDDIRVYREAIDETTVTPTMVPVASTTAVPLRQRIDLSRATWLKDGRTHSLKIFVADRDGSASEIELQTNITTLNLAAIPRLPNRQRD